MTVAVTEVADAVDSRRRAAWWTAPAVGAAKPEASRGWRTRFAIAFLAHGPAREDTFRRVQCPNPARADDTQNWPSAPPLLPLFDRRRRGFPLPSVYERLGFPVAPRVDGAAHGVQARAALPPRSAASATQPAALGSRAPLNRLEGHDRLLPVSRRVKI